MRTALFWAIMQHKVVISYQRFGAVYGPHPQGSRIQEFSLLRFLTLEDRTNRLSQNIGKDLPVHSV
jgi:hypothetical protein